MDVVDGNDPRAHTSLKERIDRARQAVILDSVEGGFPAADAPDDLYTLYANIS